MPIFDKTKKSPLQQQRPAAANEPLTGSQGPGDQGLVPDITDTVDEIDRLLNMPPLPEPKGGCGCTGW